MGGGNQAGFSATHRKDAMKAAPDHHSVLLENDQVRVLDTRLGPGEHTPIHTHEWPGALYVLSWSDFIRRDADGNIVADSRAMPSSPMPGDSLWLPQLGPHRVENVGETDLHIIAVELKRPAEAASETGAT
jgi:quercetin dioxygenase-like cupin family protein